ncbi:MAG: M20/M25/M40 family metallo-hydrolase [Tenuifilaceae bacterium]
MKSQNLQNSLFVFGILAVAFISSLLFKAPKPLPIGTSEKEFSAIRAFEHTKQVAQLPHSMGTDEHERVKNYIIDELKKLNLHVSVQSTTAINSENGRLSAGYVQNVIGIKKGTNSNKCVLIVGHYDSQPHTLGAADDGSAIASMLESAKALNQLGSFQNDIVFLFTDGEEAGLFGAKAFVDENPLKDSVGIVLNIEARGSKGPSITYEVSPENGWIMREYAKAVPYPFAHSIAYEIYKLLPNDSDFTPIRKAGLSGFNIGFIDDFVNYHSMTDSPENLSLRSLQHHGSYIMGIATHFANLDLSNTKSDDVVYFNWIGHLLIVYPLGLNILFVVLISLLLITVIVIGVRKKRLSIGKILLSSLVFIISLAIILFLSWLLLISIKAVYPHYSNFYSSNFYNVKEYFAVFTCLAIAVFLIIYYIFYKKLSSENLLVGSLLVNFIIMFALLWYIPTGAYLAIVPLILILSGLFICYLFDFSIENKRGAYLLVQFIFLIPVVTLLVPLIEMLYVTFGLGTIYGGIAVVVILMSYLVIPVILSSENRSWALPLVVIVFLVMKLFVGHVTSDISKSQPLQSNVSYFLNSDKNEAYWFSPKQFMEDWKSQFFTNPETKPLHDLYPLSNFNFLQNKSEVYNQSLPEIAVLLDSIDDGFRKLTFTINTTRKAQNCQVSINRKTMLSAILVNGKNITDEEFFTETISDYYSMNYFGISEKALELTLYLNSIEKVEIVVVESKIGLPNFSGYKPMPEFIIPDKGFVSNVTLVKRTWNL